MMMVTCPVLTMMIQTVTLITMTIQEIMAKGVGFWVVVMIILTSVLTREHFLGEYHHKANDFMRILGFKISDIININDEEAQPQRIIVIKNPMITTMFMTSMMTIMITMMMTLTMTVTIVIKCQFYGNIEGLKWPMKDQYHQTLPSASGTILHFDHKDIDENFLLHEPNIKPRLKRRKILYL